MKKLAIIAATLLAFTSCWNGKTEYYYIPKNRKPVIKNGDIVYFINHQDNNLVDTFVIYRKDYYDERRSDDNRYYHERIDLRYIKENTSSSYTFFYEQLHISVYISASITEDDSDSVTGITEKSSASYTTDSVKTEITINGTKYSVFVANSVSPSAEFPRIIYYSYTKGILRYDYSDTNYYEIKNNN